MNAAELKTLPDSELVSQAVALDRGMKAGKRRLDAVKAEIQARGLRMIEDRNIHYVKYYSADGSAAVTDTQSLEVLNIDRLRELLPEGVWKQSVTETTKTEYKYRPTLERMLKAVFTGEYTFEYTLEELLDVGLPLKPDPKQKELLLRKLKGEYLKDRDTLISVLGYDSGEAAPDLDTELWYICRIKNGELIRALLPEEFLDETIRSVRKCLMVETKTGITIDYEKED